MGMSGAQRDGGMMTEINVTPLVDVVLVLLVLMMVTATAMVSRSIPVELPKARSGETTGATEPLIVVVDEAGAFFLGDVRADDAAVRAKARALAAADPQASAVLAADGRARHESVVRVLDLLRGERISKIAIVVRTQTP